MKIRNGGIFKTIDSKDFGYWQSQGFEKVIGEVLPKTEEVKVELIVEDEPIAEVVEKEPVKEVDELPKPKRGKRK